MDDDDDFGFDDALGALPANTLDQLERDALQSTQQQPNRPSYLSARQHDKHALARQQHQQLPAYGLEDEEIVDLDALPQDVQDEFSQWNQKPRIVDRVAPSVPRSGSGHLSGGQQPAVDVEGLQRRLLELENERTNLLQAVQDANAAAQTKSGEAIVIRQRYEKSTREFEQKLATMRQLHAEAIAKHRAELDATKRDREKVATANRFLEHDLALESGKGRPAPVPARTGLEEKASPAATPKKNRALPFRDGFDDGDIVMFSPSKARDKTKPSTPKGGAKRKRTNRDDSPLTTLALPLVSPKPPITPAKVEDSEQEQLNFETAEKLAKQSENLRLLRSILNHRVDFNPANDRTMEALAKLALPSKPERRLSAVVYDRLGNSNFDRHPHGLAGVLCDISVQLWDDCMKESYYQPINVLVDLLQFVLARELDSFIQTLTDRIVPLAIGACDLVAIPIGQASVKRSNINKASKSSQKPAVEAIHTPDVDVAATLTLLLTVGLACCGDESATAKFWSLMKFDFVLLMLMRAQQLPQIDLMLQLLRTSPLPASFGSILGEGEGNKARQARRETDSVDRLTSLLFDRFEVENLPPNRCNTTSQGQITIPEPEGDAGGDDDDDDEKEAVDDTDHLLEIATLNLRITILSVLQSLISTDHGSLLLAQHKQAIGRLVRILHTSVRHIYDASPSAHALHMAIINTSTRIIYDVLTAHKDTVEVREKLRSVHGGTHMWLIALTRLAFAEALVAEDGIDEETQDCAHALLDGYLSPVEGEALLQMFSSGASERV